MNPYIMAIDQGTTGTTVLIVNSKGEVVGKGYQEFSQIYPKPGWVEHDPMEIWQVTIEVAKKALENARAKASEIQGIGITNQRETTVLWDRKTGKPIYNAIVWQCRRTAPLCEALKEKGLAKKFQQKTGLVVDAYFSGTKIAWLLDNVPGAREKASKGELAFGTIDTWLLSQLTKGKVHATDFTNASRTLIYNIHEKKWDKELLDILNIPESILPEVRPSSFLYGKSEPEILGHSIPIGGIAGDQQSALYGQGCWESGTGKNTYGTGSFLLINTGHRLAISEKGLLTTLACDAKGNPVYALEGSIFITGAAVQWLRDGLKIIQNAGETEAIAQSIPDTKGVYVVPAFAGLGAPYWDSEARAAIVGLTRGSGRAEIVRATLESIAYQTRDIVEIMNEESGVHLTQLKVDGGAVQNNFLMQFQADVLGVSVDRPKIIDVTGMGAAFLAGLSTGLWKSPDEIKDVRKCERIFAPGLAKETRDSLYSGWKKAVTRVRL